MQSQQNPDPQARGLADSSEHGEHGKNELITTDDGLDQAIQRAIAQHDLEQQQMEQQNQNQNQNQNSIEEDLGQNLGQTLTDNMQHSMGEEHTLRHEAGTLEENYGHIREENADHHLQSSALNHENIHPDLQGMDDAPLLSAAQEKQHLQMIADELKRAASGEVPPGEDHVTDTKAEDRSYDDAYAEGTASNTAVGPVQGEVAAPDAANIPQLPAVDPAMGHGPQDLGSSGNPRSSGTSYIEANAPAQEAEAHRHADAGISPVPGIAPVPESPQANAAHIPAHSELLATNTAVAAYNALLSQLPPTALLATAHLAALPLPIVPTSYMPARIQLLVSTLAVLDNLATQLLRVFAVGPYQKIIDLALSPDTAPGAAFRDLTSLFEFTKRLYSEEDPFLTVEHIAPGMWKEGEQTPSMFRSREQTIESTLRKVNLATFLAATLGTIEVGFFHLNESFLAVFCPANDLDPANSMLNMSADNTNLQSCPGSNIGEKVGKILKPQASLYLDLKTQAYISAVEAGERSNEEILEDILPSNLEVMLQERRGTKLLSPTEMDFVKRCAVRKEALLAYPADQNLNEKYEWFEFLKELFEFVLKNMGFLLWGKKGKRATTRVRSHHAHVQKAGTQSPGGQNDGDAQHAHHAGDQDPTAGSATPHSDEVLQMTLVPPERVPAPAQKGLDDITAALLPSEIQEQQIHLRINPAMTTKGPNRRPWTREEEKALRHAMELKGTQWSVILELFGQGGRINESLKNRTQVQLKDKARNWKMFFLKSGLAVPQYLQKVTGDLERDDKLRAKLARNKKTAAAPVPTVAKRDGDVTGKSARENDQNDADARKKQRLE